MSDDTQSTFIFKGVHPRPPVARLSELPRQAEEGWVVYVREENAFYAFQGGKWVLRPEDPKRG